MRVLWRVVAAACLGGPAALAQGPATAPMAAVDSVRAELSLLQRPGRVLPAPGEVRQLLPLG